MSFFRLKLQNTHQEASNHARARSFSEKTQWMTHPNDLTPLEKARFFELKKTSKKVVGLFKDETVNRVIQSFCSPRAKVYSVLMADGKQMLKCAGTQLKKSMIDFNFDLYKT